MTGAFKMLVQNVIIILGFLKLYNSVHQIVFAKFDKLSHLYTSLSSPLSCKPRSIGVNVKGLENVRIRFKI